MYESVKLKTAFRKSRVIAPLHTSGPIAITSDGKRIVTCVGEEVVLTEVETGIEVCRFAGDTTSITSFALSPSDTHLIVFTSSFSLRIYTLPSIGSPPLTAPVQALRHIARAHDAPVHVCRVDGTSSFVASGSADGVVKVWDIQRGYVTHSFKGHGGVVSALAWYYSGVKESKMLLFTASVDTRIRIFDLTSSKARTAGAKAEATLEGHVSVPRGLSVSEDGRWLVSGGRDAVVLIWDLASPGKSAKGKGKETDKLAPTLVKTIPVLERVETVGLLTESQVVGSSSRSKSQLHFYTGGEKGVVRIWDGREGTVLATLGTDAMPASQDLEEQREIVDVIYLSSTGVLVSLHADQNILFHSIESQSLERQLIGFNDEIIDATFLSPLSSQNDSHLAIATNSSLIRIYSTTSFDSRLLSSHTDMALCLDRGGDGRILASGSKDKTARIWAASEDGTEEWGCVAICEGHAESVGAVAMSRKGGKDGESPRFIFTGSQDRTIKMWDLTNVPFTFSSGSSPVRPPSLTTHKAHDKDINSLDVAPNDRLLATGSQDKTAKIFEIDFVMTGSGVRGDVKLLGTCKGHKRGVWNVKFSRAERVLATGSGDKTVKLWSLDDFSCLKTFEGHTNSVLRVEFLTQGMQLISSASDGLVKLWNIRNEECVASLDNHEDKIWALAVGSDDRTVVSGAADSVVTFWVDCTEEQQREKEAKRAEAVLKEQDFANFLALHDYQNAILLALAMDHPGRLLSLFQNVKADASSSDENKGSITGHLAVDKVLKGLAASDLARLLKHVRTWNASAKTSDVAQTILHAILKLRSANDISAAFDAGSIDNEGQQDGAGIKDLVEGLIPYTERHLARADRMVQESYIVDYILGEMDGGLFSDDVMMEVDG